MNKTMKIMSVVLLAVMLIMISSTSVMAASTIIDGMKPTYTSESGITTVGQKIVDIISTVGVVIAVIVLLVLGIKYMVGSASEKAEYKKTMIPYLIGVMILFGISTFLSIILKMTETVF